MKRSLLAIALVLAATSSASAQSLFSTRGLGTPVDPVDARSRALGNSGIGLLGLNGSLVNPAELAGIPRRGVSATLQPFWGNDQLDGLDAKVSGTRFPVIQIIYPMSQRLVLGLGYGAFLDQSWAVTSTGRELVGNDSVDVSDLLRNTGGIGQLRLSAGYQLNSVVAVGLATGLYTGSIDRSLTRTFPDSTLLLDPFSTRSRWDYNAPFVTVGARIDPSQRVRFGAAVTWSGNLDASGREGETVDASYELPLRASAGVSAVVAPRLMVAASGNWSGWSGDPNFSAPGTHTGTIAGSSWDLGVGVESQSLRTASRIFPLRLGFRYGQLPFHEFDEEQPKEWVVAGGIGFHLAGDDFGPLAVADFGVERGSRSGLGGSALNAGLDETFWRLSATISLFGR